MLTFGRSWILALALVLGLAPTLPLRATAQAVATTEGDDGPQVLWKGSEATVYRLRDGKVELQKRHGAFLLPLPGLAAEPLRLEPRAPEPPRARFPRPAKILAVSDVHGRFDTLLRLLKAQKVVDEGLRWRFGKGHLVIVGDVMDRGSQVTETYWFLRALEGAAQRAGGRVHMLLGNHEAMVLSGRMRDANPKYLKPREGWPSPPVLYGEDSDLGRWLRTRPAMLKLGSFLFIHGGLSPEFQARGLSLEGVNKEVREALKHPKDAAILGADGPLWYRGLLPEGGPPQASDEAIQSLLSALGAKALIVGHTTLEHIGAFHEGRVFGIDAGIKDGQPGEAWLWEGGGIWRGTADGGRERLGSDH